MLSSLFMSLVGRETLVAPDDTWSLLMVMCVACLLYTSPLAGTYISL